MAENFNPCYFDEAYVDGFYIDCALSKGKAGGVSTESKRRKRKKINQQRLTLERLQMEKDLALKEISAREKTTAVKVPRRNKAPPSKKSKNKQLTRRDKPSTVVSPPVLELPPLGSEITRERDLEEEQDMEDIMRLLPGYF